jgi:hypothetical protein
VFVRVNDASGFGVMLDKHREPTDELPQVGKRTDDSRVVPMAALDAIARNSRVRAREANEESRQRGRLLGCPAYDRSTVFLAS